MENLLFVVQLHGCPPEFRTLEDLNETLRGIAAPNLQDGPDDFCVWRWMDGRTPEEVTLRKARGSELPTPKRFADAEWWWIAEGVRREPYAAVPAVDGLEELRAKVDRLERMAPRISALAHELDDELRDRLGWDEAHAVRDRLLAIADGVDA